MVDAEHDLALLTTKTPKTTLHSRHSGLSFPTGLLILDTTQLLFHNNLDNERPAAQFFAQTCLFERQRKKGGWKNEG
jgi:hypothetical protein